MRCLWCFLLLSFSSHAQTSQILCGTWEGIHKMEDVQDSALIRITIQQVSGQTFTGTSSGHLFAQPQKNYYRGRIKGNISGDTVKISILPPEDSRLQAYPGYQWCSGLSTLRLEHYGQTYYLSAQNDPAECLTQPARLVKKGNTLPYTSRENILHQTIPLQSRRFRITLYDHGTVDGDTVSVYFNGQLVAGRCALTGIAREFTLEASDTEDNELVMYAENEGRVPPNTALMEIRTGNKTHRVELRSGFRQNAVVRFKVPVR